MAVSVATNPLDAATLFESPVMTLCESLEDIDGDHISIHDLLEAYSTISSRIQATGHLIQTGRQYEAFAFLTKHATSIVRCLHRDIQRAFVDPFPSVSANDGAIPNSVESFGGEPSGQAKKHARDLSAVCQAALLVVSGLFRFPVLSVLFTEEQIDQLLDDVIEVASAPLLPTPNSEKTFVLSFWILSTMRLSDSCVALKKHEWKLALQAGLEGSNPEIILQDAMIATTNLLRQKPNVLLKPFVELFPLVLKQLLVPQVSTRILVGNALCAYASGAMYVLSGRTKMPLRQHLIAFIDSQMVSRRKGRAKTSSPRLQDVLSCAVNADDTSMTGHNLLWALCVLAACVIIMDGEIFTHPRCLKLILLASAPAAAHPKRSVRSLHMLVWRCLIWAFGRLGRECDLKKLAVAAEMDAGDFKDSAFRVVGQELGGGNGIALLSTLLPRKDSRWLQSQCSGREDRQRALRTLKAMVNHRNKMTQVEGKSAFLKLLSSEDISAALPSSSASGDAYCENGFVPLDLFDGSLLSVEGGELSKRLHALTESDVEALTPLSEEIIVEHWDDLLDVWVTCVEMAPQSSEEGISLSDELSEAWKTLLLAQAHFMENGPRTVPDKIASRLASIITGFLCWKSSAQPSAEASSRALQRSVLILTTQLWEEVKRVFALWPQSSASSILDCVLQQKFDLDVDSVKTAWSELCASLVSASSPGLLANLVVEDATQSEAEVQRQLWMAVADTHLKYTGPQWEELIPFLNMPLGRWTLSKRELLTWETVLCHTVLCATSSGVSSSTVVDNIVNYILSKSIRLSSLPEVTCKLLTYSTIAADEVYPETLFTHVDNFLCDLHPPLPEMLSLCLDSLRMIEHIIVTSHPSYVVQIITCLSDGLCLWIADVDEHLLESEYNDSVMSLYSRTLEVLQGLPISLDTLETLAPFLSSAFVRVPAPALGPQAFRTFWNAISPGLDTHTHLPSSIDDCLKVVHDFFGDSVPSDIRFSGSQEPSQIESSQAVGHTGLTWLSLDRSAQASSPPSAIPPAAQVSPMADASNVDHWRAGFVEGSQANPSSSSVEPLNGKSSYSVADQFRATSDESSLEIPGLDSFHPSHDHADSSPLSRKRKRLADDSESVKHAKLGSFTEHSGRANLIRHQDLADSSCTRSPPASSKELVSTGYPQHSASQSAFLSPEIPVQTGHPVSPLSSLRSPSSDDYAAWETVLRSPEINLLRREIGAPTQEMEDEIPDSEELSYEEHGVFQRVRRPTTQPQLSGDSPNMSEQRVQSNSSFDHAHTVPTFSPSAPQQEPSPQSPLQPRRARGTSSHLDVLRAAYAAVQEEGSQMPVDDVLEAARLVRDIGSVLDRKLSVRQKSTSAQGSTSDS